MANTPNGVPTRFTTNKARLTYAFIWHPRLQDNDDKDSESEAKEKYSSCILIDKRDLQTVEKYNLAVQQAIILGQKKGLWGDKLPSNFHYPLRDGDAEAAEKGEEYAGHWFLNASATRQPRIVDVNKADILDEDAVYSGCYARVVLNLYPFNAKGKNKGIACGLEVIQKVANGEYLGTAPVNLDEALGEYDDHSDDLPFPGEPGYNGPEPPPSSYDYSQAPPESYPQQGNYYPQQGNYQQQPAGYPPNYPQQPSGYPPPQGWQQQQESILPQQSPGYPPQGQNFAAQPQSNGMPGTVPNHFAAGVAAAEQKIGNAPIGNNRTAA
jgi:hypothetical protein